MISYFTSHFLLIVLQELYEMRCRLDEADRTILLAEERLHEHNIIDENLSAMLAKVKMHSEAELRRFKEESEISYQNGVSYYIFARDQYQPLVEESTARHFHIRQSHQDLLKIRACYLLLLQSVFVTGIILLSVIIIIIGNHSTLSSAWNLLYCIFQKVSINYGECNLSYFSKLKKKAYMIIV